MQRAWGGKTTSKSSLLEGRLVAGTPQRGFPYPWFIILLLSRPPLLTLGNVTAPKAGLGETEVTSCSRETQELSPCPGPSPPSSSRGCCPPVVSVVTDRCTHPSGFSPVPAGSLAGRSFSAPRPCLRDPPQAQTGCCACSQGFQPLTIFPAHDATSPDLSQPRAALRGCWAQCWLKKPNTCPHLLLCNQGPGADTLHFT